MKDLESYILDVFRYWNMEYPGKTIEVRETRGLMANCHFLGWSAPRCCARINEMLFVRTAANK